jgi:AsmA protein
LAVKRLAIILIAAILVVVGALIVGPRFIPTETARDRIADQIAQWIGREVSFTGEPDVSFFPRPTIRLKDVTVAGADGSGETFITTAELVGTFRYLPLLWGDVELSAFELVEPTIALHVDDAGKSNWIFDGTLGERIAEALRDPGDDAQREPIPEVVLGRFRISGGTVTLDRPNLPQTTITELELDLHWPSTASPATATGSARWRGETVEIAAALTEPLELMAGRESPVRFEVVAQPIRIAFEGSANRTELDFAFAGEADVTMTSLREAVAWAGTPMASGSTLGGAAFSGEAGWSWPVLSFSNAEIRLDGNVVNGAVAIDFGSERTRIVGTIAAVDLDISPYAYAFRDDVEATGAWRDAAIDLPALADVDWDLRISADRLIVADTRIEGFAASAIVDDGAVVVRIAEAGFYGGRIEASLTAALTGSSLSAQTELRLTDINIFPAMKDVIGVAPVTGRGGLTMTAATNGASWGELIRQLTGSIRASASNGTLRGVDFGAADDFEAMTVDMVLNSDGETPLDTLTANFSLRDGEIAAERIDMAGPGVTLSFTGQGSLTSPDIGGHGVAWLESEAGDIRALPFAVSGSWLEPRFADDPNALDLIRQSAAVD